MSLSLPYIVTPRLVLQVPAPAFAAHVAAFQAQNRAYFSPWEPPRSEAFYTEAFWQEQLAVNLADFEDDAAVRLFLFERGEAFERGDARAVVGLCSFTNIVRGPFQACHLGYALDEGAVGRGLMTEALQHAIAWVFEHLRLHRVMANHVPSNERSARVLARLGFVVEGYAREYLYVGGAWQDHVLTARTNRDAPPPPAA